MCSRTFLAVPSGTWHSFRIFNKASRWASDDSNNNRIEIWAGYFLSCSTTEYSPHFRVLTNSAASSSLNLFFLWGSSAMISFPFLFFSFASFTFLGWYTRSILVISPISRICLVSPPPKTRTDLVVGCGTGFMMRHAMPLVKDWWSVRIWSPITRGLEERDSRVRPLRHAPYKPGPSYQDG